ncbi:MAG: hypothetical protein QXU12_05725 [Nitrososphaerota archaeon]
MIWEDVRKHYLRPEVSREITEYCANRWVAIHCEEAPDGVRPMIRYWGRGKPLTIERENDIVEILERFSSMRPRAFYATAHIYRRLQSADDLADRENIARSSPTWDIDSRDGDWRKVVKKALEIVDELERHGVAKSIFFKWSGRGAHVHVHPRAFSDDVLRRISPLDIAYSVTQHIACRIEPEEGVVVENKIDVQRVFTAPLSLHRSVDRVAVCTPPDELRASTWTGPVPPDTGISRMPGASMRRAREMSSRRKPMPPSGRISPGEPRGGVSISRLIRRFWKLSGSSGYSIRSSISAKTSPTRM